jgi:ABC-type amino acid transport substrate-binding protein
MNAGHIDLLPALYYSEARAQHYNFTSKYLQVTEYIFARDDTAVTSENDLPGKTVAILKGSLTVDRFRQAHPEVRVLELESVEATIHAVATYKADLLYDTLTTASLTLRQKSITNIRPIFTLKDSKPNDVFMATRQGLPLLSSIISKVLDAVPEAEKNAIISKWEDTAKVSETADSSGYGGVRVIYALIAAILGIMLILYVRKRVSVN